MVGPEWGVLTQSPVFSMALEVGLGAHDGAEAAPLAVAMARVRPAARQAPSEDRHVLHLLRNTAWPHVGAEPRREVVGRPLEGRIVGVRDPVIGERLQCLQLLEALDEQGRQRLILQLHGQIWEKGKNAPQPSKRLQKISQVGTVEENTKT